MTHQCHTSTPKRHAECKGVEVLSDDDSSPKPQIHQKKAGGTTKATDISAGEFEVLFNNNNTALPAVEQSLQNVPCAEVEILSDGDDLFEVELAYQGLLLERDLVQRLRARTQYSVDGPFRKEDLQWTPLITSGGGRYKNNIIAVIPWNRLEDFIR